MEITLDGVLDIKLYQNRNGYRFSVDPVLLYSFVNVKYAKDIADLGAGSGIIGLMLAKKYKASKVLLIELQESLYRLAENNISINDMGERVRALLADIKDIHRNLQPMSYDLVVSNPPFRKPGSGRVSLAEERAVARHEIALKFHDLAEAASYLLKARGRFFLIFHPERLLEAVDTLRDKNIEPKRVRFVHNDLEAGSKIVLVEAVKEGRPGIKIERPLFIYDKNGAYTDEVKEMYGYNKTA
ncbi:MAG: tRNA1(Val) (adenine(37)-N6)-methyltransferase [Nitrospirota bacterium]